MGKRAGLNDAARARITSLLGEGRSTLEISRIMGRDHRTIKSFVFSGKTARKTPERSHLKKLSPRELRNLKREMAKNPNATSKSIFDAAAAPKVGKTTRCKALQSIGRVKSPIKRPLLSKAHKAKRVEWAVRYHKVNFSNVIFTDECRATLDGPDGWARGWVLDQRQPKLRMRRQQGGGGVMFWAGIQGSEIIGPYMVPEGVKINAKAYCELLDQFLFPWLENQPLLRRRKLIFQHDNAPAHKAKFTTNWLNNYSFGKDKIMVWPANSPDLNPIENLWAIIKRRVYQDGRQFTSTAGLWKAIQDAAASVTPTEIKKLTSSVDSRVMKIIKTDGSHVSC